MRRIKYLVLAAAVIQAAGCSDSHAPVADPFSLEITVTGPAGLPLAGLEARLHVKIPGVFDYPAKPYTRVGFSVAQACSVTLTVHDMEGNPVSTLFDRQSLPGEYQVGFGINSDNHPYVGTRLYRYTMVARLKDAELFRESRLATLYASIDHDQRPVLGISDSAGHIRFSDQREFPFLYEPGPQPLVDENGLLQGTFAISDTVSIVLTDPATLVRTGHAVVITPGRNRITLVRDVNQAAVSEAPAGAGPRAVAAGPIPPVRFELRQNTPNPFN